MASKNVLDSSYYAFEYMKEYKNRKKKNNVGNADLYLYETFIKFS